MKEYILKKDKYLKHSIIAKLLKGKKNYILISHPNTGKTQACLKAAQESGKEFIFAVDTKILADQLSIKYGLPVYYKGKELPKGNCITLYNHIGLFKGKETILFVDEFHSLTKDYGYKKELIDKMINGFPAFKQIIGLTGTPLGKIDGFEEYRIIQERDERAINLINYTKNYLNELIYQIMSNRNMIHYISIFDKSNQAVIINATLEENGINKEQIANINSDTKSSQAFKDIVTKGEACDKKIVITTFTQGFNIQGKGHMLHIIPNGNAIHSASDIEQVVNRFRKEVPVINLYWNHDPNYTTSFNEVKQFEVECQEAKVLVESFLSSFTFNESKTLNKLQCNMMKHHLDAESILNVTMECKSNLIGIHYNIYSKQTKEMYRDIEYMKELLLHYKYKINQQEINDNLIEVVSKKANERTAEKHKVREDYLKDRLQEIHLSDIKSVSDELSNRYNLLCKVYSKDQAYKKLQLILLDKKKWNREKDILDVKCSSDFASITLKENIYSIFTKSQYSSKDIHDKINSIHKKLGMPLISSLTKTTLIFEKYFNTEPWKVNNGNGRSSGRKIISRLAA